MLILALDTAGRVASAALCRDGAVIAHCERDSMMDHSRTILPVCEEMLAGQGLSLKDIDVFAAVCGPGSYTGIRIGVAAVKGFAFGCDRPCVAVSTLEAAAWADDAVSGPKLAVVQARPGEYYAARFEQSGAQTVRVTPDGVMTQDEIAALLQREPLRICGSGAQALCAALGIPESQAGAVQDASSAARCAYDRAGRGQAVSCHDIKPSYLRPTQAERMKQQKEEKQL